MYASPILFGVTRGKLSCALLVALFGLALNACSSGLYPNGAYAVAPNKPYAYRGPAVAAPKASPGVGPLSKRQGFRVCDRRGGRCYFSPTSKWDHRQYYRSRGYRWLKE